MIAWLRADPLRALLVLEWIGVVGSFVIDIALSAGHLSNSASGRIPFAVYIVAFITTAACVMSYPHTSNRRYVLLILAVIGIEVLSASPVAVTAPIVTLLILGARLTFAYGLAGTFWTWALGFAAILVTAVSNALAEPTAHPLAQSIAYVAVMALLLTLLFGLIAIVWLYQSNAARSAAAAERSRIALDLHDSLGHTLTTLSVHLQNAVRLRERDAAKADTYVTRASIIATQLLDDLRETVTVLHDDAAVKDLPASPLLSRLQSDFVAAHEIALRWDVAFEREPSGRAAITLYRLVQEALTNVVRHADAHSVTVAIHGNANDIHVVIEDDGTGFDITAAAGHGLTSMQSRIESAAGEITFSSTVGSGTRVEATIPMESST